MKCVLNHICTE